MAKEDPVLQKELEGLVDKFKQELKKYKRKLVLSGEYDRYDAILTIIAGAGGDDAQDWAAMLYKMYRKYLESKGYKLTVLDVTYTDNKIEDRIGIKDITLLVEGLYAFGNLKKESGVHRLVRISPFSAQQLRHTSFALVEVIPKIPYNKVEIKNDEIEIETKTATGPGGQYVNKRQTAVRIRHKPTGIVVTCQSERSLDINKQKAMEILAAKLYDLEQKKRDEKIQKIKGEKKEIGWGNQIRSYILHPYKLLKDYRSGYETSDVEKVLEGDLDDIIEAELYLKENDNKG
ncbi:Peptide chain release factor 2 [bacterium HR34]|nr:Peptide chain release factor 2 [bacterium HR34]